jgi:hypothetical protein
VGIVPVLESSNKGARGEGGLALPHDVSVAVDERGVARHGNLQITFTVPPDCGSHGAELFVIHEPTSQDPG